MGCVLVIDDDYAAGIQTASIVEEAGYSVAGPEASVYAAQKVLGCQKIDLALLEVNLGGETTDAAADSTVEFAKIIVSPPRSLSDSRSTRRQAEIGAY